MSKEADLLNYTRELAELMETPFNLELKDISVPDKCPVTGAELRGDPRKHEKEAAWIHVDDDAKGYVPGNVRVMSVYASSLLSAEKHRPREAALLAYAREAAEATKTPFDLNIHDIVIPDKCPIFGKKLRGDPHKHGKWAPLVHRKDPEKGYTRDNIQIVSAVAVVYIHWWKELEKRGRDPLPVILASGRENDRRRQEAKAKRMRAVQ